MPPTLTRTDEALEVSLASCRGAEFSDTLAKIRDMPGRRFDGETKRWLLPPEPAIAEKIVYATQATCEPAVMEWIRASKQAGELELVSRLPEDSDALLIPWASERTAWQPETFTGLYPFQRAMVNAMVEQDKAINASDMGLGKSIMALSTVAEHQLRRGIERGGREDGPRLIVCPNSVKGVWGREVGR